jgi:phage shock protein A
MEQLQEMVTNLEAQLVSLYAEKQSASVADGSSSLQTAVASLEEQLRYFYSITERLPMGMSLESSVDAVTSLEEQAVALTKEKMELEVRLAGIDAKLATMKANARAIGAVLVEVALFGDEAPARA